MDSSTAVDLRSDVKQTQREAGSRAGAGKGERPVFSMPARRAFFDRIVTQLRRSLPEELAPFQSRAMFQILKISYDNDRIHYEVGVDNGRRQLEIALHFEDGPASTMAYLAHFDRHILELKHRLGPEIELERWTVSWGRIYDTWPLATLDRAIADRAASRMVDLITVLQPLVVAAEIPAERFAASSDVRSRGRWHGKR